MADYLIILSLSHSCALTSIAQVGRCRRLSQPFWLRRRQLVGVRCLRGFGTVDPGLDLLAQFLKSPLLGFELDLELRDVFFAVDSSLEKLHCSEEQIDSLAKLTLLR